MGNNIWKVLLRVIASVVILFVGYFVVSLKFVGNEYINLFGYTYFEVGSGSMSPTIKTRDVVIVKLGDKYNVGDIITFKRGNNYITHRVIKIDGNKVITLGDANNIDDFVIDKNMVIGRVIHIIKRAGIWRQVFSNFRVIISLIVTIMLFVLLFSYRDKLKKYRMRKIHYREKKNRKKRVIKKRVKSSVVKKKGK